MSNCYKLSSRPWKLWFLVYFGESQDVGFGINQSLFNLYSSESKSEKASGSLLQSEEKQLGPPEQQGVTVAREKNPSAAPDSRESAEALISCSERTK